MLKRWAIFGMLLVVFCAYGCANQIQAKDSHQKPSEPISTIPQQQDNGASLNGEKQKDVHADVKIVNPPQKDFYDKAPVWINLAIILAALLTLLTIKRQADIMEAQAKDARESGAETTKIALATAQAAQKSADAALAQIQMMKDKERGRLRVAFDKPDLVNDPDPDNGYELSFRLILDGTTQVYITESSCFVGIHESGDPVGAPWWNSMEVPETITPENRIYKGAATILTGKKPWGEPETGIDEPRVALAREDKLHVFARGFILYKDIFGGTWGVRFNLRWNYSHNFPTYDEVDLTSGYWESVGDNGEHKVEQPQNPN